MDVFVVCPYRTVLSVGAEPPFIFHLNSCASLPRLLLVVMNEDFVVSDDFLGEVSVDLESAFEFPDDASWMGEMECTQVRAGAAETSLTCVSKIASS